jgi:homoserine dehydrogenase
VIAGGSPLFEENSWLGIAKDGEMAFYLHLEVEDRPRSARPDRRDPRRHEVSVRSVVQRGMGDDARLEMVVHEVSEKRFKTAIAKIAELEALRSPPRSIRVIEEEFV